MQNDYFTCCPPRSKHQQGETISCADSVLTQHKNLVSSEGNSHADKCTLDTPWINEPTDHFVKELKRYVLKPTRMFQSTQSISLNATRSLSLFLRKKHPQNKEFCASCIYTKTMPNPIHSSYMFLQNTENKNCR